VRVSKHVHKRGIQVVAHAYSYQKPKMPENHPVTELLGSLE
jgi:hypothetical protein